MGIIIRRKIKKRNWVGLCLLIFKCLFHTWSKQSEISEFLDLVLLDIISCSVSDRHHGNIRIMVRSVRGRVLATWSSVVIWSISKYTSKILPRNISVNTDKFSYIAYSEWTTYLRVRPGALHYQAYFQMFRWASPQQTICVMTSCSIPEHPSRPFLDQTLCEHSGVLVGRAAK